MAKLHRYLSFNLDKIEKIFGIMNQTTVGNIGGGVGNTTQQAENGGDNQPVPAESDYSSRGNNLPKKKLFTQLSTLLAQLGTPPDVSKMVTKKEGVARTPESRGSGIIIPNHILSEFLLRVEARSGCAIHVESLKEKKFFYEGGLSKERRPVVYYVARRVLPDALEMEMVIYFIITTLRTLWSKPFEMVVDCTQFSGENEWHIDVMSRLEKLLPDDVVHNLQLVYFYNVNTAFGKFTKKASRVFNLKIGKRMTFISSLVEFSEYLGELRLPKSTLALERDVTIISPVTKISTYRQQIPVDLKLSQDTIQVTYLKRQDVLGHYVVLNDIYHIGEIEDVSSTANRLDEDEFVIRYAETVASFNVTGGSNTTISTLTFSSPKKDMILQTIRSAKAKYQLSRPKNIITDQRHLRPSDVPGTLLNMAMLNMGSEDANLRLASYNLLYSLSASFNFDVGNQILSAKGIYTSRGKKVRDRGGGDN